MSVEEHRGYKIVVLPFFLGGSVASIWMTDDLIADSFWGETAADAIYSAKNWIDDIFSPMPGTALAFQRVKFPQVDEGSLQAERDEAVSRLATATQELEALRAAVEAQKARIKDLSQVVMDVREEVMTYSMHDQAGRLIEKLVQIISRP